MNLNKINRTSKTNYNKILENKEQKIDLNKMN